MLRQSLEQVIILVMLVVMSFFLLKTTINIVKGIVSIKVTEENKIMATAVQASELEDRDSMMKLLGVDKKYDINVYKMQNRVYGSISIILFIFAYITLVSVGLELYDHLKASDEFLTLVININSPVIEKLPIAIVLVIGGSIFSILQQKSRNNYLFKILKY